MAHRNATGAAAKGRCVFRKFGSQPALEKEVQLSSKANIHSRQRAGHSHFVCDFCDVSVPFCEKLHDSLFTPSRTTQGSALLAWRWLALI